MKKHLLSFILILLGAILLVSNFYNNNIRVDYPETVFAKDASKFDNAFNKLLTDVESDLINIRNSYDDTIIIKDYQTNKAFFTKLLNDNSQLLSVSFVQNNFKFHIYRSKNSLVMGVDSTDAIDIINWERIKDDKVISKWEESFEIKFRKTDWFNSLEKDNNHIHWIFDIKRHNDNEFSDDNTLFYAGYSYENKKSKYVVLLSFSRLNLLKNFDIYKNYERTNLFIETNDGNRMNLGTGITELFENVDSKASLDNSDSLKLQTLHHFSKFDGQESGIFNFSYKQNTYWNSFKRFDSKYGIRYYLLSIPNADIVTETKNNSFFNIEFPGAILFIFMGILLLFISNNKFHRAIQRKLPSLIKLLEEDENRYLEFKSSLRWDYRQEKVNPALEQVIFKTIAAFGNTDGGILLIGVDDDKNILGLDKDFATLKKADADYFEIHLRNLLHTLMGVKYVSKYIRMDFEISDKKTVCKIKILKAGEPLFLQTKDKNGKAEEKFYVRSGNSSQEIKSIADINDYINTRWK